MILYGLISLLVALVIFSGNRGVENFYGKGDEGKDMSEQEMAGPAAGAASSGVDEDVVVEKNRVARRRVARPIVAPRRVARPIVARPIVAPRRVAARKGANREVPSGVALDALSSMGVVGRGGRS
jgi:hypothetical protein